MDIGGAVGGEIGDEVGDLGELAAAPKRRGLGTRISLAQVIDGDAARVGESLLIGQSTQPRRLKDTGRNGNNAHAQLAELLRPRTRKGIDRILRCRIDALPLRALDAALRAHVDDNAVSLCGELSPNFLCTEIDALEVNCRYLIKDSIVQFILTVRILRINQETRNIDACIVDEDIDMSKLLLRRSNHRCNTGTLRHISNDVKHLSILLIKGRCLRVHIADDNIRTLRQKLLGDRLADPRRAARNNRRLSLEIQPTHIVFSFSLTKESKISQFSYSPALAIHAMITASGPVMKRE